MNWKVVEFNQKEIDTIRYDTILLSDLELDCNQRLNLDGLESESLTIWFGSPNCLSLAGGGGVANLSFVPQVLLGHNTILPKNDNIICVLIHDDIKLY